MARRLHHGSVKFTFITSPRFDAESRASSGSRGIKKIGFFFFSLFKITLRGSGEAILFNARSLRQRQQVNIVVIMANATLRP